MATVRTCCHGFEWPSHLSHLSGHQRALSESSGRNPFLWSSAVECLCWKHQEDWCAAVSEHRQEHRAEVRAVYVGDYKTQSSLLPPTSTARFHQSLWGFCLGKEKGKEKCHSRVQAAGMAGTFLVRWVLQPSVSESQNNPWPPLLESLPGSGSPQNRWCTSGAARFCLSNPVPFGWRSVWFSCSSSWPQRRTLRCGASCRTAGRTGCGRRACPSGCSGRGWNRGRTWPCHLPGPAGACRNPGSGTSSSRPGQGGKRSGGGTSPSPLFRPPRRSSWWEEPSEPGEGKITAWNGCGTQQTGLSVALKYFLCCSTLDRTCRYLTINMMKAHELELSSHDWPLLPASSLWGSHRQIYLCKKYVI